MNSVESFRGLNTVADPLRLDLDWLVQADNVDITDTGALRRRDGYTQALAGAFTGAYATIAQDRMFLVESGVLKAMAATPFALQTLTSTSPMYWCEIDGRVFFNNGTDSGIIEPDNTVTPWRSSTLRDTEFLDADGQPLSALLDPLPLGTDVIQAWRGRIYAAQYQRNPAQSVIWFSQPLGYHLFRLDTDFIAVGGRVLAMAPHESALIICTDAQVLAFDGTKLEVLADYGVVPGMCWAIDYDDGSVLIWTVRGLCRALPFKNLTEGHASVAPGVQAGAAVINTGGQKRFVVALHAGGTAFNRRS